MITINLIKFNDTPQLRKHTHTNNSYNSENGTESKKYHYQQLNGSVSVLSLSKLLKKLKASKKCGLAIKLFTEYQNEVIKIENLNMQLQSILLNR